jgi:hypothetical protein
VGTIIRQAARRTLEKIPTMVAAHRLEGISATSSEGAADFEDVHKMVLYSTMRRRGFRKSLCTLNFAKIGKTAVRVAGAIGVEQAVKAAAMKVIP